MPFSEADTRANYIDPALQNKGWQAQHIRREYSFADGRKLFGDRRGERCRVDYLLIHQNIFIAIIEAKSEEKELITLQTMLDKNQIQPPKKNINPNILEEVEVPIPNLLTQQRIPTYLNQLSSNCNSIIQSSCGL
ncbi:MAG TPA: hypothetical protein PKG90_00465 [Chitinophagaceae bacterium]|nr:hypothetical protein [Chitinophagaceae bacterium]HNU13138.1 hypothetical protein [Chitinophagaceae bacterium]